MTFPEARAYEEGRRAASLDDAAICPYPDGDGRCVAWLAGFTDQTRLAVLQGGRADDTSAGRIAPVSLADAQVEDME